jgi:hypothetical protein
MGSMRRRESPRPGWPEAQDGGPVSARSYAPETALVAGTTPDDDDDRVRGTVLALPDGAGPLHRVGICNAAGTIYREVALHGPVQLLYLWAGMNALGFRQRPPEDRGFSRYGLLFTRERKERRPLEAAVE